MAAPGDSYSFSSGEVGPEYEGCEHYKRHCQLLAPCCNTFFACRFCHDAVKDDAERDVKKKHNLDRKAVKTVRCMACGNIQDSAKKCTSCGQILGNYYCGICNLFDDVDKKQFHCDGCGICRVGGREKYIHCDGCNACFDVSTMASHKCREGVLEQNCPVCMEYLHTSTKPTTFLKCGHPMHVACFNDFVKAHNYKCPLCSEAIADMSMEWKRLDLELALTPMPGEYATQWVRVLCNDCHSESDTKFHIIALKCRAEGCGSYNTRKIGVAAAEHNSLEELAAEDARVEAILREHFGEGAELILEDGEGDDDEEEDEDDGESSTDDEEDGDIDMGGDDADAASGEGAPPSGSDQGVSEPEARPEQPGAED